MDEESLRFGPFALTREDQPERRGLRTLSLVLLGHPLFADISYGIGSIDRNNYQDRILGRLLRVSRNASKRKLTVANIRKVGRFA